MKQALEIVAEKGSILCTFLTLQVKMCVLAVQSCPTLCNPVDCSPLVSSVLEILQVRILEWVTIPFSRGSSQPRDRTQVSYIAGRFFTISATGKPWSSCTPSINEPGERKEDLTTGHVDV